jgi:type II restriction enzyme
LRAIIDWLSTQHPKTFELETLISKFVTDERYVQSIDKLYEVIVYALFEVVTRRLDARISLTINPNSIVLKTFDDFALMVLGVNSDCPRIEQPAKLYRVGKANASDGGLDMWANFGPAVQVKHVSLTVDACEGICEKIYADKIIIVCKDVDADVINAVLSQVGLGGRVRGIIPESLLCSWYRKACDLGADRALGSDLLELLVREMSHEFSTSQDEVIDRMMRFSAERRYRYDSLPFRWQALWVDS